MTIYIQNTNFDFYNENSKEHNEFDYFGDAIVYCQKEFGFSGDAWDDVIESRDFNVLQEFLEQDGVDSFLGDF